MNFDIPFAFLVLAETASSFQALYSAKKVKLSMSLPTSKVKMPFRAVGFYLQVVIKAKPSSSKSHAVHESTCILFATLSVCCVLQIQQQQQPLAINNNI